MAVVATPSNHFKYMLATKKIDLLNDDFKIILMTSAFAFDKDAHATLADITSFQLATGNGYTQDAKALAGVSVNEDDTNDRAVAVWNDVIWTADGGNIGAAGAACIIDDTTTDDTVVGCIDFGEDITAADGKDFQIRTPTVEIG